MRRVRVLGLTFLAGLCCAVPANAESIASTSTAGGTSAGGATAPTTTPGTTTTPTTPSTPTTPVAPVSYKTPIVRPTTQSASSSSVAATDVLCEPATTVPALTTTSTSSGAAGGAATMADAVPCPSSSSTTSNTTGGSAYSGTAGGLPDMIVAGNAAKMVNGLAAAPANAPASVQEAIWQANDIIGLPYIYGGGHASFISPGYDCSGTVSYALHGGALLSSPLDSTQFETWGSKGRGQWITIFANGGHAYMVIAGLRLDTSAADDPSDQQGPRWRPLRFSNAGYVVRHPTGL